MRANQRHLDPGPTWLLWWLKWAFGLIAVEVIWLVLVLGIAWLAVTGRRKARR
jgi:hypothetical protein